jgi:FkbM family methyltransferase
MINFLFKMKFIHFSFGDKSIGKEFDLSSPKVPADFLNENSVVYSFGAGEDNRYEFLLCGSTGCKMHIFDPTPRAIDHFNLCMDVYNKVCDPVENTRYGRGDNNYFEAILKSNINTDNIFYHDVGLYDKEDTIKFYYPKNPNHVSLSIDNIQSTKDFIELNTKPIDMIVKELGGIQPDLLKLNIEGAEVKSLIYMMESTDVRPQCICVMFELFRDKPTQENKNLENLCKQLLSKEYDLIYNSNEFYTFFKKDLNNGSLKNTNMEPLQNANELTSNVPTECANMHLIMQYYNDKNSDRQQEIDFCVQANLENPHIIQIHNLVEENTVVPSWLSNHEKYIECKVDRWLTYKMAFEYANENLPQQAVALTNADIFFDHSSKWEEVKPLIDSGIVLCISRHEFDGVGSAKKDELLQKLAFANCQDTWIWRSPLNVENCDFMMGKLGCDNAIADRIKKSGYVPVNSPNQFKTFHYDICRGKTVANQLLLQKPNPERPEEKGYYLVPDIDALPSCDHVMEVLGLGAIRKYQVICDVMTKFIGINNAPEKLEEMKQKYFLEKS